MHYSYFRRHLKILVSLYPTYFTICLFHFSVEFITKNQLGPRYEGQLILMAELNYIPHPKRPPRMPSRRSSFFAADGRALLRTLLRTIFTQFCGGGGGVYRRHRTTTSFGPQRELPLARLVIHRQTSARARHKGTLSVQPRSSILYISSSPISIGY